MGSVVDDLGHDLQRLPSAGHVGLCAFDVATAFALRFEKEQDGRHVALSDQAMQHALGTVDQAFFDRVNGGGVFGIGFEPAIMRQSANRHLFNGLGNIARASF